MLLVEVQVVRHLSVEDDLFASVSCNTAKLFVTSPKKLAVLHSSLPFPELSLLHVHKSQVNLIPHRPVDPFTAIVQCEPEIAAH